MIISEYNLRDSTGLNAEMHQSLGILVHENVESLAEHYKIKPAVLELTLLSLISQEMLSLVPADEMSSDQKTFEERVSSRVLVIQKAVDGAVASIVDVNTRIQELQNLNHRLIALVQKMSQSLRA